MRKRHPLYFRAWKYGLSVEELEALIESYGGRCPVCRREEQELVVDHDHETGRVRGMLCDQCNRVLDWVVKVGFEPFEEYLEPGA